MENKTETLDLLNKALVENKLAVKRGPLADTICKRHVQEAIVQLQKAIKAVEGLSDEIHTI